MKFAWIAAVALSVFSFSGCRPDHLTPQQMDLLANELAPHVKTLSREISLFHYTHRPNIVGSDLAPDPFDPRRVYYVRVLSDRFFDNYGNCDPCIMGKGLYTATDPVESHSYGGDDWALVKVALPAGARILNAEERSLSDSVYDKLDSWGCGSYMYDHELASLLSNEDDAFCRGIARYALRKLGIDAVTYGFGAEHFQGCETNRDVAILLINSANVDWSRTEVFTAHVPPNDPVADERAMINEIAERTVGPHALYWPGLPATVDSSQTTRWVQEQFFSCGNYPEDRI